MDVAVDAFTSGVAWVNHDEEAAGTLKPGLRADVVVLDQDLYAIPAREIGEHLGGADGRGRDRGARATAEASRERSPACQPRDRRGSSSGPTGHCWPPTRGGLTVRCVT